MGYTLSASQSQSTHRIRRVDCKFSIVPCSRRATRKYRLKKYPLICKDLALTRSKNHLVKTEFATDFKVNQQKNWRVPIHMQKRVEQEMDQVINQEHVKQLGKCSGKLSISRIANTVKKNQI